MADVIGEYKCWLEVNMQIPTRLSLLVLVLATELLHVIGEGGVVADDVPVLEHADTFEVIVAARADPVLRGIGLIVNVEGGFSLPRTEESWNGMPDKEFRSRTPPLGAGFCRKTIARYGFLLVDSVPAVSKRVRKSQKDFKVLEYSNRVGALLS